MIALFSGMRLNEICQLHVSDIKRSPKGTHYFDVNDDEDKHLKNEHSKRRVPIHPQLIKIGFLEFVSECGKGPSKRLFSDLRKSPHGHYSEQFSRWFNERFSKRAGVKTEKNSFHSFRHTVRDAMRAANIPLDVVDAIGGWNTVRGPSTNYGKGHERTLFFVAAKLGEAMPMASTAAMAAVIVRMKTSLGGVAVVLRTIGPNAAFPSLKTHVSDTKDRAAFTPTSLLVIFGKGVSVRRSGLRNLLYFSSAKEMGGRPCVRQR